VGGVGSLIPFQTNHIRNNMDIIAPNMAPDLCGYNIKQWQTTIELVITGIS
jgi:hypothetical protein